MTPAKGTTALAPGLRVRPWRHHLAAWDPAARLALHDGVVATERGLAPSGPARAAAPEELASLDGRGEPADPALEVFTSPALLREHFWSLDPDELPGADGAAARSPAWTRFADEVREFLRVARVPLPAEHALLLTVRDAAAAPGLWSDGPGRALLHVAAPDAAARAVWLNLGEGPTALVFYNVPLVAMARLLGDDAPKGGDGTALLAAFAARFPRCPLVRLTLGPGDGALIPLLGLAVDADARSAEDLDVGLVLLPGPRGGGAGTGPAT